MKILRLTFSEQTHPHCQGFACDDHIDTSCHLTPASEEFLTKATPLLTQIEQLHLARTNELCEKWLKDHPESKECTCEGEEFVGLRWVHYREDDVRTLLDATSNDIILAELHAIIEGYTEA